MRATLSCMECATCREGLSAGLDGEAPPAGVTRGQVDAHLAGCADCTGWFGAVSAQHRDLRVRAAEPVPDLTTSILAAVPAAARPQPVREWVRYALFAVATTQLLLALPALVLGEDPGAATHVARELGSFDVALAVGLLWAAWQPRRVSGLLPTVAALAGAMVVTALLDVARGNAPALGEAHHVLDLAGLALLWLLARPPSRTPSTQGLAAA